MYKYTFYFFILILVGLAYLPGCGSGGAEKKDPINDSLDSIQKNGSVTVKIGGKLFSVPSPIQVAMLIKDVNVPFNRELLNKTQNRQKYTTTFKQALNLGAYGANLGYLNMYEQLPDAAQYFATIKSLSKDLNILNSISESTMKRIEKNSNNKDSLIYITSTMFRDVDAYLLSNKRSNAGVLILAGGWIESMYMMSQILKTTRNQAIIDRVGEQKYPIDNLVDLLRPYYTKEGEEFDKFLEQLVELASIFDGVTIEYKYEPSKTDEANKITTINCMTKTIITDYQLKTITETVASIRKKIVE